MTVNMSGTMDLTGTTANATSTESLDRIFRSGASEINVLLSIEVGNFRDSDAGTLFGEKFGSFGGIQNIPSNGTGTGLGFSGSSLGDQSFGNSPGEITVNRTWTAFGQTVVGFVGADLDDGPMTLWTHATSGDSIILTKNAISAVPEPSSITVIGLASIAACFRRRRR